MAFSDILKKVSNWWEGTDDFSFTKQGAKDALTAIGVTKAYEAVAGTLGVANIASSTAKVAVENKKTTAAAVGVTYLASKSDKLSKDLLNAPKNVDNFTTNLGKVYDNPTIDNAVKLAKDNPFLTGATALGAGVVLGKGTSSIISTGANTLAIKENTKAGTTKVIERAVGDNTDIAKISAKSDLELAKIQLQAQKEQQEYNLKLAQINAKANTSNPQPVAVATPIATATVPKKKTTKKKTTKKKTAKKKPVKKKATKKKPVKKKTTKKATKR